MFFRQSVQVETQMTSVERVLEYCALDQEPPAQVAPACQPPAHWPSSGQIVFETFSMSYSKDPYAPVALDRISLTIQAGEKIGIVGRTGAGKSSFIQTLFRMGSHTTGRICIDQIDIDTVGLDDVRRRISIIPQDPVLFTGTMRSNLDQFGDYSDAEIWYALEQVCNRSVGLGPSSMRKELLLCTGSVKKTGGRYTAEWTAVISQWERLESERWTKATGLPSQSYFKEE